VRAKKVFVPIGVLSATTHPQRVIALRRTDRLEVVTYDWAK